MSPFLQSFPSTVISFNFISCNSHLRINDITEFAWGSKIKIMYHVHRSAHSRNPIKDVLTGRDQICVHFCPVCFTLRPRRMSHQTRALFSLFQKNTATSPDYFSLKNISDQTVVCPTKGEASSISVRCRVDNPCLLVFAPHCNLSMNPKQLKANFIGIYQTFSGPQKFQLGAQTLFLL